MWVGDVRSIAQNELAAKIRRDVKAQEQGAHQRPAFLLSRAQERATPPSRHRDNPSLYGVRIERKRGADFSALRAFRSLRAGLGLDSARQ